MPADRPPAGHIIRLDTRQFDGPRPFDPELIKWLKQTACAIEHLRGALKRDKAMSPDERKACLALALIEIGVAHGIDLYCDTYELAHDDDPST